MTPFASVAMLEKLALLKIALWRAPAVSRTSVGEAFTPVPFVCGVRRSEVALSLIFIVSLSGSGSRRACALGGIVLDLRLMMRPNAERLERVLGDEPAVLADDHDGRDGRSFDGIAIHRCLHLNARVLAHGPLTVATARTAAGAAGFESCNDLVLVVNGNALVPVHGIPR